MGEGDQVLLEMVFEMIVAGMYSIKRGKEVIESDFAAELDEIRRVVAAVDATAYRIESGQSRAGSGAQVYNPEELTQALNAEFEVLQWHRGQILCGYSTRFYAPGYTPLASSLNVFREIDLVKHKVGVDILFDQCASVVYDICAEMTIFHNMGIVDVGIGITPIKAFADNMSTGVSYFEQIVWDLEHRGVADIDIPVLILGVMAG